MIRSIVTGLMLLLCFEAVATALPTTPIYTYYLKPPFIIDDEKKIGLFYDFVHYINSKNSTQKFSLIYVPRKRLDEILRDGELDGPIIGVNPIWFNDKKETKYRWTAAIYRDTDDFMSLKSDPFEYVDKDSLQNKSFAGVAGHYYVHLYHAEQSRKLKRVDTIGGAQILRMIEKQRTDFGVVSRSTYQYLLKHKKIKDIFHRSTRPHESFERRLLVPQHLNQLATFLTRVTNQLPNDEEWQAYLKQYQ